MDKINIQNPGYVTGMTREWFGNDSGTVRKWFGNGSETDANNQPPDTLLQGG